MADAATIQDYSMIDGFIRQSITDYNTRLFGSYDEQSGYFNEEKPEENVASDEVVQSEDEVTPTTVDELNADMGDGESFYSYLMGDNNNNNSEGPGPITQTARYLNQSNQQGAAFSTPASSLNADSYLAAIFGNEGGKTGVDPKNVRGTASGKFAIIKSGRKDLFNKFYKGKMTYDDFEKQYNSNPSFEYEVAKKLAQVNIAQSKTAAEAIGRWYSPQHAASGDWDTVPRPDFGNKLTVGKYVNNAFKNYKQAGGHVATTLQQQYVGLNDSSLDDLILPLQGTNIIRGLDSGEPVEIQDEEGKVEVLYGPKHTARMKGKVYEKRISKYK